MARTSERDAGLKAAIDNVGSICQLAWLLGLSQPTVSVWKRVPPHRVIRIKALTGVSRRVLGPDLYDVPSRRSFSRNLFKFVRAKDCGADLRLHSRRSSLRGC